MIDQNLLIVAAVIILTVLAFLALRRLLSQDEARLVRRLALPDAETPKASAPASLAGHVDQSFEGLVQRTGLELSPGQVLGFIALAGIGLAVIFFYLRSEPWAAGLGVALGLALPLVFLLLIQGRRRRLIQGQLPDAFYFMARSLRAGLSLEQTLARAGEQLPEPLAAEFRNVSRQIQLGLSPHAALQHTGDQLQLADFNIFVSTVGLYYHAGGNLALLLDRLAASTRDRVQFLGYFQTATALGRISALVLGAAVPLLVVAYALLEPEYIGEFFQSTAGWQLLGIVALLELIGIVWLYYLLRVDY